MAGGRVDRVINRPAANAAPVLAPILVTVIGGYLGAGKTTLVNHVLGTADARTAVLVNDFGEINIDAALIESNDGEMLTLANGCVCCSMADGLASALLDIAALEPRPERLLIEASGVADPAGVAAYCHRRGFRLDLVVVLVDATDLGRLAVDHYVGETVRGQLAAADLIVFNKTDLADQRTLIETRSVVAATGSAAPVLETIHAAVAPAVLFGLDRLDQAGSTGSAGSAGSPHARFISWTAEISEAVERTRVESWAATMPHGVVRAKGIFWFGPDEGAAVLQWVRSRWTLEPLATVVAPPSKAVAIAVHGKDDEGRSLAPDWIARTLAGDA